MILYKKLSQGGFYEKTHIWYAHSGRQSSPQVLAVGFNCTAPHLIAPLLEKLKQVCDKPLLAYPNSGEVYNGVTNTWQDNPEQQLCLTNYSHLWKKQGVQLFGGCCRTRPEDIRRLAGELRT